MCGRQRSGIRYHLTLYSRIVTSRPSTEAATTVSRPYDRHFRRLMWSHFMTANPCLASKLLEITRVRPCRTISEARSIQNSLRSIKPGAAS